MCRQLLLFLLMATCFQHHEMSCPAIVVIAPTLDFVTVMLLQFFWVYDWWFIMFNLGFIFGRCICDSIIFIVVSQPHMLRISLSLSRCFSRYIYYIVYIYKQIHFVPLSRMFAGWQRNTAVLVPPFLVSHGILGITYPPIWGL
jgi:hypothetical protein